jgi:mono/diheme cytochrome c family protein
LLALILASILGACRKQAVESGPQQHPNAYESEIDSNNAEHVIPLNYEEAQGKRLFNAYCVWCHADSTPAGPSNRSNLTPVPHLASDGSALNPLSDQYLENMIALGGSAVGKSAMMPPWGKTLDRDQIRALIAYMRAVAQPPYQKPARPGPSYERR